VDIYLACLISGFSGGIFSASIAKWLIQKITQRALDAFDSFSKKIAKIETSLAVISNQLELLAKHEILLHEHDRKIVSLESRHGRTK
jgi:hypothetical protein